MEFCCTCAAPSSSCRPQSSQKPRPDDRRLGCCARVICGECIQRNHRFASYCPYCQISTGPSPLPQTLRDPPSYTSVPTMRTTTVETASAPPPYTPSTFARRPDQSGNEKAAPAVDQEKSATEDTLHFLNHHHDTVDSLSLRYRVPASVLRRKNNITSDHLLLGRKTILIPGEYYRSGVSLSPRPVEGEAEELRKAKIRRFMTTCKVSDYDVASLYLEQSCYHLETAIQSYVDDDNWEKDHPRHKVRTGATTARGHKSRSPFWQGL